MAVTRGELRVLGYRFSCGPVGPKLWRIPKGCRTVPTRTSRAGIENYSRDTPNVQNYTCEVFTGTAVEPLDSGFAEGFVSWTLLQHRKIPANFNGHPIFQLDRADSSPDFSSGCIVNPSADLSTDSGSAPSSFVSVNLAANGIATLRHIHLPIAWTPLNLG